MHLSRLALVPLLLLGAAPVWGADAKVDAMAAYVKGQVSAWMTDPVILTAIADANAAHAGLDDAGITALDDKWRAEVGQVDTPTINEVVNNAASNFLRQKMTESGDIIVELILMDNRGLNVGVSSTTSDYWQGDEAKWQNSFGAGAGGLDVGDIEFDESSQIYESQVSITINDPASGAPIGALTVGLNADKF